MAGAEVRLVARNNEILAVRKTDNAGHVLFEAGLARGEGGLSPALLSVSGEKGDYAFLSLKSSAFDLTDRGVAGRVVPAGPMPRLCRARRLPLRRDGLSHGAAARRPRQRGDRHAADAGGGAPGRRRVPPQRGGGPGPAPQPDAAAEFGGAHRHLAGPRLHRSEGPRGRRDHLHGRDYIADRIEFTLSSKAKQFRLKFLQNLKWTARFLYGAPASGLALEGDVLVAPPAERSGFAGYVFGVADEATEAMSARRSRTSRRPTPAARHLHGRPAQAAVLDPAAGAQIFVRMVEAGGRAVERKLTLPVAERQHDRRQAAVRRQERRRGRSGEFRRGVRRARRHEACPHGLRYELLKLESRYHGTGRLVVGVRAGEVHRRVADGDLTWPPTSRRASRSRRSPPLPP